MFRRLHHYRPCFQLAWSVVTLGLFLPFAIVFFIELDRTQAADSISHIFPISKNGAPGYTIKSGFRVSVESNLSGNRGYRPVQVTISSAKPVAGDTLVTLRLVAGEGWRQHASISVEQDF